MQENKAEKVKAIFDNCKLSDELSPDYSVILCKAEVERILDIINSSTEEQSVSDRVNHPKHYNSHPSGIECIDVIRWYDWDIGSAIKYLWRCGLKSEGGLTPLDKQIEDLEKAVWCIQDKIKTLKKTNVSQIENNKI